MLNVLRRLGMLALVALATIALGPVSAGAQGVTTAAMHGLVTDSLGQPVREAQVVAVHLPTGTQYRATVRSGGAYNLPNLRVGGPYQVTVTYIGYRPRTEDGVMLVLGQDLRLDFILTPQVIELEAITAVAEALDETLNAGRTGAATFIGPEEVAALPSVKRSTRDLIRTDPRNDGNYAFAGRNWLYNNISLDGSYFNNPFGLDDPAPGGQTNAEPVPFDAVEQVQVSVAPFDVRQGGFTGASVNTVTKSGTNMFRGSAYSFYRNEDFLGNEVRGQQVIANPDLTFNQTGFTFSGPIVRDRVFFFIAGELERTDDPGTNFVARTGGAAGLGVSRVEASVMDSIRNVMINAYDYDPGQFQGFIHETNNDKLLARLDFNVGDAHTLMLRYNYLNAERGLPPHPFVLSFAASGRGPNESSLPFQNSGYRINNELNSFAVELKSRGSAFSNRFFASYNRFRDFRDPNSEDFPTIEIGENGVTYTTVGHEPFSIHNILDQDVWQFTNDFTWFTGNHALTFGATFESFDFFNSFNIFRHGVFFLPAVVGAAGGTTFSSLDEFFRATDPNLDRDNDGQVDPLCSPFGDPPTNPTVDACQVDFNSYVGGGPFKGENIHVGQLALYVQDELLASRNFNLTLGVRADFPIYFTDPVANPFSTGLTALDELDQRETVDQASLPGATPLLSPRLGFNWDVIGDRSTQLRGGTGIFTGRVPFVWVGNVISNPGGNPNLWGPFNTDAPQIITDTKRDTSILQQSFDLNAMDPDFSWPQLWTTNVAFDRRLGRNLVATLEVLYGKDLNSVFVRNADLRAPVTNLGGPDARPFHGSCNFDAADCPAGGAAGAQELNPDGGAGIYVIDNRSDGHNLNITAQLQKTFDFGLSSSVAYSFTEAKNILKSTEIASVLWAEQPVRGDPNLPEVSFSEFGSRHRVIATSVFGHRWSPTLRTQVGLFLEIARGNRFAGAGGNRYSFLYSGDVNGDGSGGNDLLYVPANQGEILLDDFVDANGNTVTAADQWTRLNAFIEQDDYLSANRGRVAERFGGVNPWFHSLDLRVLQDFAIRQHTFQLSVDVLNVTNLLNSTWGVRKVASAAATSPLRLVRFESGQPVFNFTGPNRTFVDDPSPLSRWRAQIGLRYLFN